MYGQGDSIPPEPRSRVILSDASGSRLWMETARPRAAPSASPATAIAAPMAGVASLMATNTTTCKLRKSPLDYNGRTLIDHFEQFDHVRVAHPHTAMTRNHADFVLVFGAMNVDEAVARIRILLV
jgi:hypothetical protein